MNVIVDTSVVQYLHQAGMLRLLPDLYGAVVVPGAVIKELDVGRALGHDLPVLESEAWVTVAEPKAVRVLALVTRLGPGERNVLALALETDGFAVLDDGLARFHARRLGIRFTGTLGVLLKAKRVSLIDAVAPAIARLEGLGFRVDERTRGGVLRLAGE